MSQIQNMPRMRLDRFETIKRDYSLVGQSDLMTLVEFSLQAVMTKNSIEGGLQMPTLTPKERRRVPEKLIIMAVSAKYFAFRAKSSSYPEWASIEFRLLLLCLSHRVGFADNRPERRYPRSRELWRIEGRQVRGPALGNQKEQTPFVSQTCK
jgi:hypothetical protein